MFCLIYFIIIVMFYRRSWMTVHRFGMHTPLGHQRTSVWCMDCLNSTSKETSSPQLTLKVFKFARMSACSNAPLPCNPDINELCTIIISESQLNLPRDLYQVVNFYMHSRDVIRALLQEQQVLFLSETYCLTWHCIVLTL